MHAVMPVKLCCPSRMASISGYVNPRGLSPGLFSAIATTSLGLASPGMGFSNAELIQLKIVAFAPIPSASVRMAIAANPGALAIIRRLYRTSCQNEVFQPPPGTSWNDSKHVPAHTRVWPKRMLPQCLAEWRYLPKGRCRPIVGRAIYETGTPRSLKLTPRISRQMRLESASENGAKAKGRYLRTGTN